MGIRNGKKLKAVVAGGSSVPILPAELILKLANGEPRLMSYESLGEGGFATGTMLGSGGFIAMDEDTSIVKNLWTFARFYHHESCGQCSPCREGTGWMEKILHKILDGHGDISDIDLLWDIQSKIEGKTICPLGEAAAWPVASAIRHFRSEFEEYVRNPQSIKQDHHYYGSFRRRQNFYHQAPDAAISPTGFFCFCRHKAGKRYRKRWRGLLFYQYRSF